MDSFSTRGSIDVKGKSYTLYRLSALAASHPQVARLPWSMKVLLENLLRKEDGRVVRKEHIEAVLSWDPKATPRRRSPSTRRASSAGLHRRARRRRPRGDA
jgi:aconitate hydratase